MTTPRSYSNYARQAARLLGEQIRVARKQRRWSEKNLSERAGISRATLQKIEQGDMGCRIGLVFEVANLVGVTLFEADSSSLSRQLERTRDINALLPRRITSPKKVVHDDF